MDLDDKAQDWAPPDPADVVLRSDSPYVGTALHSSFNRRPANLRSKFRP